MRNRCGGGTVHDRGVELGVCNCGRVESRGVCVVGEGKSTRLLSAAVPAKSRLVDVTMSVVLRYTVIEGWRAP